ncbi:UDP-glycosyltransferase UGT5-like [Portunus trituberculatus]|nr:UDP-glycosyltransferase UGT5-like [Portunus trituberculatus]
MATVVVVVTVMMMLVKVHEINAARILMAVPIGARSHENFFMPLAEHLTQRNHTVTYLSGFESTKERPNIRVVFVPDVQILKKLRNLFTDNVNTAFAAIFDDMLEVCVKALSYEGVQRLNDEKFDLIILHAGLTECFLSFAHKLKVPFIFVNPNKITPAFVKLAGTPDFPSLSANYLLDLEIPLTFTGRMINSLYNLVGAMSNEYVILPSEERQCRERQLCPDDMPSFHDLRRKTSLFITNIVRTMENPSLPYTPTVVHAGGIHCRPAKPLPQDLQQWVASSGKPGFIYFSLGSLVPSSEMPEKYLKVLVEVFGSLEQRVLWKWDDDTIENLPPNVRLSKWLPQQDILGHPQLRLFITHGGLFSTQEATYHGVPILGMPVSIDQHHNMRTVKHEGWGDFLYWEDLTYDKLQGHILQLLDDASVKEKVERRSTIIRDQPMSPGDWATYWIEYVLRHQGAHHLRSPVVDIPWYQLYNVDVWALLVVVTLTSLVLGSWLSYRILLFSARYCCGSSKTKKD